MLGFSLLLLQVEVAERLVCCKPAGRLVSPRLERVDRWGWSRIHSTAARLAMSVGVQCRGAGWVERFRSSRWQEVGGCGDSHRVTRMQLGLGGCRIECCM